MKNMCCFTARNMTCHQEYPELFWGTNINMKNISDYDNQETIAQLLWNIRMTRIRLGVECWM